MRVPKVFSVLFALALIAGMVPFTVASATQATIEPDLLAQLNDGPANFSVRMSVQADLSAAYAMDWAARGQYVVDALQEVARVTQAPVIEYATRHGLEYTSFLSGNEIYIRGGNLAAAQGLAAIPGVADLRLERIYTIDPIVAGGAAPEYTKDWGLTDINADDVWALGYEGAGIKVANIDTGVQYSHPALDQAFACPGDPGNAACWKDPSNICSGGTACDNNGHGTHTMGTMVGDNDPSLTYWVGMAPDAKWIACKGCESSSCSEFALNSCADWILAPGGNAANRPNVVNNSWGGGGGSNWYLTKVNNWRAAGIFPAFSAGNSGSSCGTLGSPGDYQQSFASAAHASSRTIASYSSRGPSAFGHDPYTKPNISAPGSSICSSVPTNGWSCGYSGTSMASPHSAGAVALIWQACPSYLGQIDATFELLQDNADTPLAGNCNAPPDGEGNYTYGYGYLNVLAAVNACATTCDPVSNAAFGWTPTSPYVGDTVTFSGSADGTAPIAYSWTFGDGGTGSGQSVTHTYTAAGTFTVTLVASNGCPSSQTVTHTITVQEPAANSLHINTHTLTWSAGTVPGTYKVNAAVRVHDQAHARASGVTVYGTWTLPNGRTVARTAVTNLNGLAKLPYGGKLAGTYTFCVTNLAKSGYTYNPAANEAPACQSIAVGP
jgi:PKD repeat protein